MEPKVILVDYLDNPLGEMKKGAAHASPHLHRAFSVFLYHDGKYFCRKEQRISITAAVCGQTPAVPTEARRNNTGCCPQKIRQKR